MRERWRLLQHWLVGFADRWRALDDDLRPTDLEALWRVGGPGETEVWTAYFEPSADVRVGRTSHREVAAHIVRLHNEAGMRAHGAVVGDLVSVFAETEPPPGTPPGTA